VCGDEKQLLICGRFQASEQCWATPELPREGLDRAQGRWTDVMFHAFDVMVDGLIIQAEQFQKVG
jgi:hypothetical protein